MKTVPLRTLATAVIAVALLPAASIWVARDLTEFHQIVSGDYKTPWYSTNWLEQPYTNLRLALRPAREYWTMNAIQNERWLVREVVVGDVTFWAALHRVPTTAAEPSNG